MISPFLKGKSVYLRAHLEKDLSIWTEWFNDSRVTQYLTQGYVPNVIEFQKQRLEGHSGNPSSLHLAVVCNEKDKLVGTTSLNAIHHVNRNAEISILIGDTESWGKGYGREAVSLLVDHAFSKLNLHKIVAGSMELNVGSIKLFESLGFAKEAVFKEQVFHFGKYYDAIRFAIFDRDFKRSAPG